MMPVKLFPEPASFDAMVRQKGLKFLEITPNPNSLEWSNHSYWQEILPEMRLLYCRICNYCATWIPSSTGTHSVDHFLNKKSHPRKAYEWNNFRYASARFNSRKGTKAIIDPTNLPLETFILDFTTFFVEVNSEQTFQHLSQLASETITILKLNEDDELVEERMAYFKNYTEGHISFSYLQNQAPFIAHEINRQGLRTH